MKALKITYWVSTAIFSLMMLFSAYSYFTKPEIKLAFQHLGFPDYFRIELAVAKLTGALVLLAPLNSRIKEWAYAGFGIVLVSAFIAHVASGDPVFNKVMPLIFLALLVTSYTSYHKSSVVLRPAY